jgi:hypothetical protein
MPSAAELSDNKFPTLMSLTPDSEKNTATTPAAADFAAAPYASFWQRKLAALLHDSPSKALDIRSHEDRADAALNRAVVGTGDDGAPVFDHAADWTAAAADRLPFPHSRASGLSCAFDGVANQFHHPLGGGTFNLKKPFASTELAEEAEQVTQPARLEKPPAFSDAETARADFFAHWRLWGDWLADKDARAAFLPADTRIPDHTIFHHNAVTAAFAAAGATPALLRFHLGPVQSFIAAARSTRDLWSGSFLLSWLVTTGLKTLSAHVGPDAVIFPNLLGQPLFDLLWREEIWAKLKSAGAADKSIWDTFNYGAQELLTPNFPNTFLALVPAADVERAVRDVERAVRAEWEKIAGAVWNFSGLQDEKLRTRFDRQIARHLAISWQVTPFPETLDAAEELAAALPDKSLLARFHTVRETFEQTLPVEHRDPRFYAGGKDGPKTKLNNAGLAWSLAVALSAWQLDATRQTRAFDAWSAGGTSTGDASAHKDALNGKEEKILSRENFSALTADAKKLFKHNDPVGATTLVKRLWHLAYLQKFPGLKNANFPMPNTHSLAKALDAAAAGADVDDADDVEGGSDAGSGGKYFAILAFDGDDMGKWVSGEKTPPFRDQLADYKSSPSDGVHAVSTGVAPTRKGALEYFERIGATALLKTPRLLTPSYHLQFSEALSNFALHVAPRIVRAHKGRLIYAGGDDVLAMLPAASALACANDLQRAFNGRAPLCKCGITQLDPGFLALDGKRAGRDQNARPLPFIVPGPRATASVGIAMAHFKAPLQDVVRAAQAAEKRAKKHSPAKNAFAVSVFKRSGEITEWNDTFRLPAGTGETAAGTGAGTPALAAFGDLLRLMNEDVLSSKFPHKLLEFIAPYASTGGVVDCADFDFTAAVERDLALVVERQRGKNYSKTDAQNFQKLMRDYLQTLAGSPTDRHRQLSGLLTTTAFLARQ